MYYPKLYRVSLGMQWCDSEAERAGVLRCNIPAGSEEEAVIIAMWKHWPSATVWEVSECP